jgi:hypothetical protein
VTSRRWCAPSAERQKASKARLRASARCRSMRLVLTRRRVVASRNRAGNDKEHLLLHFRGALAPVRTWRALRLMRYSQAFLQGYGVEPMLPDGTRVSTLQADARRERATVRAGQPVSSSPAWTAHVTARCLCFRWMRSALAAATRASPSTPCR